MKNFQNIALILLAIVISITACVPVAPSPVAPTDKAIPTATELIVAATMPVPAEGKAVVCGYLLDGDTSEPPQAALFLSPNIAANRDDVPAMMSFSFQTNPRAEMTEEGYFCFEDVDPGVYALTLWSPPDTVEFIESEDGQDYLWVIVEASSVLDMGHLTQ